MTLYALGDDAPQLPAGFHWIAPNAQVIGKVIIGEDVGIWFGAAIRGDIEPIRIGAGSNIQENCVLHTDSGFALTIGANCTIGHNVILHGCTIGENSLIGMGAIVLNGAVIGANCLIGAGALVTQNTVIPDNSLVVGAPARIIRQLDATGAENNRLSAERYIANARRFAGTLRPLD